jgi:hypothetical protein
VRCSYVLQTRSPGQERICLGTYSYTLGNNSKTVPYLLRQGLNAGANGLISCEAQESLVTVDPLELA